MNQEYWEQFLQEQDGWWTISPTVAKEDLLQRQRSVHRGQTLVNQINNDDRAWFCRQHRVGEYDRRVVLLTKERGKISAFAKGARRPNSPPWGRQVTSFAFGEFMLYEGQKFQYSESASRFKIILRSFGQMWKGPTMDFIFWNLQGIMQGKPTTSGNAKAFVSDTARAYEIQIFPIGWFGAFMS